MAESSKSSNIQDLKDKAMKDEEALIKKIEQHDRVADQHEQSMQWFPPNSPYIQRGHKKRDRLEKQEEKLSRKFVDSDTAYIMAKRDQSKKQEDKLSRQTADSEMACDLAKASDKSKETQKSD